MQHQYAPTPLGLTPTTLGQRTLILQCITLIFVQQFNFDKQILKRSNPSPPTSCPVFILQNYQKSKTIDETNFVGNISSKNYCTQSPLNHNSREKVQLL